MLMDADEFGLLSSAGNAGEFISNSNKTKKNKRYLIDGTILLQKYFNQNQRKDIPSFSYPLQSRQGPCLTV